MINLTNVNAHINYILYNLRGFRGQKSGPKCKKGEKYTFLGFCVLCITETIYYIALLKIG